LDIFFHRKVKIIDFLPNNEADPSGDVRSAAATVALDEQDLLPHAPMRIDTKKSFTDSDKNGEVQNRIRRQLPELNTV
jgi:hypothetical protein